MKYEYLFFILCILYSIAMVLNMYSKVKDDSIVIIQLCSLGFWFVLESMDDINKKLDKKPDK